MAVELEPKVRPRRPESSWRNDDDTSKSVTKKPNLVESARIVPPHKIDERFMAKNNLEAAVKVTWTIDQRKRYSEIFALSEVNTFSQIGRSIASKASMISDNSPSKHRNTACPNLHIDKFTINTTNQHNERITSETNPDDKTYRATGTEYSPETFNALMEATASRMSAVHNTCACDDEQRCEATKRCPEIRMWLSSLDGNNRRIRQGRFDGDETVKPDNVIIVGEKPSRWASISAKPKVREGVDDKVLPKVMINIDCLRRLRGSAPDGGKSCSPMDLGHDDEDVMRMWFSRDVGTLGMEKQKKDASGYNSLKPELRDISHNITASRKQPEVQVMEIPDDDNDDADDNYFQRGDKGVPLKIYDPIGKRWQYDINS